MLVLKDVDTYIFWYWRLKMLIHTYFGVAFQDVGTYIFLVLALKDVDTYIF